MSKTADIEFEIRNLLNGGPQTLDRVMNHLSWVDDRRWVGIAIDLHLIPEGKARWASCDDDHNHDGRCILEGTR